MGILVLHVCFEHDYWVFSAEVVLPCVGILHGDEIDLIQHKDDLLIRHTEYLPLNILTATRKRIPDIKNLNNNITSLNQFLHLLMIFIRIVMGVDNLFFPLFVIFDGHLVLLFLLFFEEMVEIQFAVGLEFCYCLGVACLFVF